MSLQVWLPLNGNLDNQGLASVTVAVSGTTAYTTGKIGQGLSGNGSSFWTITGVTLGAEASIACWSKTSTNGKMQWVLTSTASDRLNLYESDIYTLNVGDGNANPFKDGSGNNISCLHDGKWHHFVVTFGSNVAKLYIDGVHRGTAGTFRNPTTTSAKIIRLGGGYGGGHSYDWNGVLNDFRVYDNCLSDFEIKQLSQGLILHYLLTGDLPKCKYDSTIYTEPDNSVWIRIFHHNNPSAGLFASNDTFSTGVYKNADRWYDVESICNSISTYEFMVKQKNESSSTEVKYRWKQTKNPVGASWSDVKPDSANITRVTTSGYSTSTTGGGIYIANSSTRIIGANSSSGNWFGAMGCWTAYQGGIPGFPNTTCTTGYIDLYVRIDNLNTTNNVEYDCSGYCNNGTRIGTFTWTSNAPKYAVSQVFNGTDNAIQTPNLTTMVTDKNYTIACWTYKTVIGTKNYQTIYGGPSGFELEARSSSSTSPLYRIHNWGGGTTAYNFGEWTHFCFVHTDSDSKLYVNGELKITGTSVNIPSGNYFVGAWNTSTSQNYEGNISDFRIYATALSADDIKSLYNNNAYVDASGNVYGQIR